MTAHDDRFAAAYQELLSRAPENNMQPRLQPIADVCDLLGSPQKMFRTIHITGTNGKTSVARFTERLLAEHNLRVGRFTSPHLMSVTERIVIDGEPISEAAFVDVLEDIAPFVAMVDGQLHQAGEPALTFFEILAIMAIAAFADAPVDVAVIEVGLGGTWDATNVVDADVAVVTSISLDHTSMLGNTLAEIASEKSGIIKENSDVVLGQVSDDVAAIFQKKVHEPARRLVRFGHELNVVDRTLGVGGQQLTVDGIASEYRDVFVSAHGQHQAHNATLAICAVEMLLGGGRQSLNAEVLTYGLADITLPGRLENVSTNPTILADASHNPAGMATTLDTLEESFDFNYVIGLVGILADKDAEAILEVLEPVLDEVIITESQSPRAIQAEDLADMARDIFGDERVRVEANLAEAIVLASDTAQRRDDPGCAVLATGSVTIAGEVRLLLKAPAVDRARQHADVVSVDDTSELAADNDEVFGDIAVFGELDTDLDT